jgi:hypothetical protein
MAFCVIYFLPPLCDQSNIILRRCSKGSSLQMAKKAALGAWGWLMRHESDAAAMWSKAAASVSLLQSACSAPLFYSDKKL